MNKITRVKGQKQNRKVEELIIDTTQIQGKRNQNILMITILSIISALCSYMGFCDGFEIESSLLLVFITIIGFSIITQIILSDSKKTKIGIPIFVAAMGMYVVTTSAWIVNGFTLIINQIITYINVHKAEMHIKYVVSHKTEALDIALATIGVCAVYTFIINVLLKYKRVFICAIILMVAVMSNLLVGGEEQVLWITMTLMCVVAIFYLLNIRIFKVKKGVSFGTVLIAALTAISLVFGVFVEYTGIRSVDDIKDEIVYRTGNVIYGKSDYPEGQFKRFDEISTDDEEVRLTVTMTNPVSMYLKGYVGCQYTEKGWKKNDENIYGGDNLGMSEWFLDQGFYPLTQAAYYMGYSRNDGRNIEFEDVRNSSIHIVNNSASTKYQYVPENLLDMSGLIDPKQDVNFVETDIFSEEEYWYDILYYAEDDYLDFPSQLWFENNNATTEQQQFIQAENYYHGFVSTYYLEVPEKEAEVLEQNIPSCNNNVYDALWTIRNYLKDNITYSEECMEYNPDKNYLQQTLLEDKRGNSAHFATVATLMFRYYGVPARYVEGYWMPNEEDAETIELTAANAHAWVEVYIKGLGFVPMEVTPGFYQEEEAGGTIVHKNKEQKNQGGQGTSGVDNSQDELVQITWNMVLIAIIYLLIICLIIFIMVLLIRRAIIVSKRKKGLASDDNYKVVATASQYIDDVCIFVGRDIQKEVPEQVREILEKIKFSNHALLEEEKDIVCQYMKEIVEDIWKKQSVIKKMVMMFWKGLK